MFLLYLCQKFCLRSVCLSGKAGETEPKLVVALSNKSILELPPAGSGQQQPGNGSATVEASILHPHGSRGLLILQSGSGRGSCPSTPGLFLPCLVAPALHLLEHRAPVNSFFWLLSRPERSFWLWVSASETLHTNKPCEKESSYRFPVPLHLLQSIKWAFQSCLSEMIFTRIL